MLQHQIDLLKKHEVHDIRVSLGVKAEAVIEYLKGKNIEYANAGAALGTAGNIRYALDSDTNEPFMVLNGDVLSDINLKEFQKTFSQSGADFMLVAYYLNDVREYGHLDLEDTDMRNIKKVNAFLEKPKSETPISGFMNAGVYICRPERFLLLKKGGLYSMEKEIFPQLVREGKLYAYIHDGWWREMGTEERLAALREELGAKHKNHTGSTGVFGVYEKREA